jgi:transposase
VWRALPADFPPWRTVYGIYQRWHADGAIIALHDALRGQARRARHRAYRRGDRLTVGAGRCEPVPRASRSWDNAKKVTGRKRHIAVDAAG